MKKWMVLVVLGLFLFGCDSDDEETGGCDPAAADACAEGESCLPAVAEAAPAEEEEGSAVGDLAGDVAATEAANAGGDIAGAATGAVLGGDDEEAAPAATYTCQPTPEVEEEEEIEVPVWGPEEGQVLSTDGSESDHVAKGCDTFDNATDGLDPGVGFCVDTGADGDDFCADTLGGVKVSGKCDGGTTSCCSEVACDATNSAGVTETGVCMGQVAPTQGGDSAPANPACDGAVWMNSTCPNDNAVGSDGNVGCCMAAEAGPEMVVVEEAAAEEAAEGEAAAE